MALPPLSDMPLGVMPSMPAYEQYFRWPTIFVYDTACPLRDIDDIMVVDDVAFKSEGVHVRGGEMTVKDLTRFHPKAIRKADGSKQKRRQVSGE